MNLICRNLQYLNYTRGLMQWAEMKAYLNKGMADEDALIADGYHILFINAFGDSYIFDMLDELGRNKDICRHQVRQQVNSAIRWINGYDERVFRTMKWEYTEKFADMNDHLQDAFKKMLARLEESVLTALKEKGCKNPELIAKLQVSIMLCEFANENLKAKIKASMNENPILKQIEWTSHEGLLAYLMRIDNLLKSPDITKDIIVRDRFIKMRNMWCNEYFVADNIGDPVFEDEESSMELKEIIKKKAQ